jgi:RNA polymerase sigma-70 factor (ECF subfamily)
MAANSHINQPELIPTRRTLLSRLKQWDDHESWQDFFNTYWKLIYGVALRAGLDELEAQDVVQDTVVSVAKQMPNFKYNPAVGSFKTWLLLITRRRINDHLRKQYRRVKVDDLAAGETSQTARIARIPDPTSLDLDAIWDEEWKRQLFDAAVQRVKNQVDAKQFQIFDCYVLKEWPVKDVASTFSVTPNQIYVLKHRISGLIAAEIKKLEFSS